MNLASRLAVRAVDLVNRRGKALGVRLVHWTGKRPYPIHPKHLVDHQWHDWYLPYLSPADRFLGAGCANGAHLVRAATRCRSIVGFDYDLARLPVAARTIRERGVRNARVFAWDITGGFPFQAGSFEAALFLDVIEHLVPRVEVLQEIRRVLREDGRLLVSGPNRETRWRRTLREAGLFSYSDPDHKIEYSREEFLAELAAAGGVSLRLYDKLSCWKREAAERRPEEGTGFRVVARKRR